MYVCIITYTEKRNRSGVELPPNFEGIPLDKKALQKLEELGVPYTQGRIRNVAH